MFEWSVLLSYLVPKKRNLSVTLIALLSVGVITLVVWLILLFLSLTEGIERGWIGKLTSLNAPLRVTPTKAYYDSYYYRVDSVSEASSYTPKSLGEKALSPTSDPYDLVNDAALPYFWTEADRLENGSLRDPVKGLVGVLQRLKREEPTLTFEEFELSGAILRLNLVRPGLQMTLKGGEAQSFLTQASYLASYSGGNPYVNALLVHPSVKDFNHNLFLANYAAPSLLEDDPASNAPASTRAFKERTASLLQGARVKKLKTALPKWRLPSALLPEGESFTVKASGDGFILTDEGGNAEIQRIGENLYLEGKPLASATPLFLSGELLFEGSIDPASIGEAEELGRLKVRAKTRLQGRTLEGVIPFEGLEVVEADVPAIPLPSLGKPIYLAKQLQETGVLVGDQGYLSYQAATVSSLQEMRLPVTVAGFYDPGLLSVGNKCILAPREVVRLISSTGSTQYLDKLSTNGYQVWFKEPLQAKKWQERLSKELEAEGLSSYWKVSSYHDYDFAKDLLRQFESDRILFTLIGLVVLLVACCNIISLLILLVNDKKKEIGILQAMGATKKSIALIFGLSGALIGLVSSALGISLSLLTIAYLPELLSLITTLQGGAFYGVQIQPHISQTTLWGLLIATPLLSLAAGLIPAIKACRLKPSALLRSEA